MSLFNFTGIKFQRACAYGVEPLVERLVKEGADCNTTNCFGYTPMLEACHRGFVNIVAFLLRGGVNLRYVSHSLLVANPPFMVSF